MIIDKLGSASSKIVKTENSFQKTHLLHDEEEYECIVKGIEILGKCFPENIVIPEEYCLENNGKNFIFNYKQEICNPWVQHFLVTSKLLHSLSQLILQQQEVLIANGLTMVDARPSNYFLGSREMKLVDLGSIKKLNTHSFSSFVNDFRNNFILPLQIEKSLGIPVSNYFKGGLESIVISPWQLRSTYTSLTVFKNHASHALQNIISAFVSSSGSDFIEIITQKGGILDEQNKKFDVKPAQAVLREQRKIIGKFTPNYKFSSNWVSYTDVHKDEYNLNKTQAIDDFVNEFEDLKISDLGSNLTTINSKSIALRLDIDTSVCSAMQEVVDSQCIIINGNLAKILISEDQFMKSVLTLDGKIDAAIMTSIIHHLVIGEGLSISSLYANLRKCYKTILLEYQTLEDPMIKLLIKKKGEVVAWDWEDDHLPVISQFFHVSPKIQLSSTRFAVRLNVK